MISYKNPQRIGHIREMAGLNQTALAKRMNVSPSLISHWEAGVRTPSETQLIELARALGVTPDYLVNAEVCPRFQFRARVSLPDEEAEQLLKDASQQVYFVDAVFKMAGKNLKPFGLKADFDHQQLTNIAGQFREALRLNRHVTLGELKEALREWNVFVFEWAMPISVSGLSYRGATTVIIINAQHTKERKLFTLAHEFAHVLFHLGKDQNTVVSVIASNRDPQEKEANKFATELLMASSDIDQLIKDYGSSLRQPAILGMAAKMFNVSPDAMFYRLTQREIFRWTEKVKYIPVAPKEKEKPEFRVTEISDQVSKELLHAAVSLYENQKATTGKLAEWFFAPRTKVEEYLTALIQEQENGICCEDG
jgi:Zn-dependent peptidase ImmA (M78 family)/DNA-binding XRE family transcriptional regulator